MTWDNVKYDVKRGKVWLDDNAKNLKVQHGIKIIQPSGQIVINAGKKYLEFDVGYDKPLVGFQKIDKIKLSPNKNFRITANEGINQYDKVAYNLKILDNPSDPDTYDDGKTENERTWQEFIEMISKYLWIIIIIIIIFIMIIVGLIISKKVGAI